MSVDCVYTGPVMIQSLESRKQKTVKLTQEHYTLNEIYADIAYPFEWFVYCTLLRKWVADRTNERSTVIIKSNLHSI